MEGRSAFALFLRLHGWIAAISLVFAILFGILTLSLGQKAERLESDGAIATATVLDKRIEERRDDDGDIKRSYWMDVRFPAGDGTVTESSRVSRGFYGETAIGDAIPVTYWRPDPTVFELEPGSTRSKILIPKIISALALAGSLFWGWHTAQKAQGAAYLYARGERRRAQVIEHAETNYKVNKRPRYRLVWRDETGLVGRSWPMGETALANHPKGADLTIYADPAGKLPSVWEGDVAKRP